MTRARRCCSALLVLAPLFLPGCNRQPRISDVDPLDVCGLVSAAEAERLIGPIRDVPATSAHAPGFAGGCTWSFTASEAPARLSAMVMTKTSAANAALTPTRWFEDRSRMDEARVTLGSPTRVRGVGDAAWLYGTTLFVRQGEMVVIVRADRAEPAQLEGFAQLLLSPKKP